VRRGEYGICYDLWVSYVLKFLPKAALMAVRWLMAFHSAVYHPAGFDPAGLDPASLDPAGLDPAGYQPGCPDMKIGIGTGGRGCVQVWVGFLVVVSVLVGGRVKVWV
jgi:hypothetical protein